MSYPRFVEPALYMKGKVCYHNTTKIRGHDIGILILYLPHY